MPDTPTFVVNDRRKFTSEGEPRHDAPVAEAAPVSSGPQLVTSAEPTPAIVPQAELTDLPESSAFGSETAAYAAMEDPEVAPNLDESDEDNFPPGPTEEQIADAIRAYDATVDRLDTALRAADPGAERMPVMNFERLTQSLYTQALMLLGGATQPGEQPRVDILGARQTIDMLAILADRTKGNLSPNEEKLLESALFDLRMGFLEITQALARQAAQRQTGNPQASPGLPGAATGPRIVR